MVQGHEVVRWGMDVVAAIAAVGALAKVLPPTAALFTIIWTGLQIYSWFENRRKKKDS